MKCDTCGLALNSTRHDFREYSLEEFDHCMDSHDMREDIAEAIFSIFYKEREDLPLDYEE